MRTDWRLLSALSLLSAVLLGYKLGAESLWLDEMMSLDAARASWGDLAKFFSVMPEQHPVYYLLLRPWLALGTSATALRAFSVVFAVASIWVLYQLTLELFDRTTARMAAVLLVVSPFAIYYGQEARMYTLELFLAILSTWCLTRWLSRGGRGRAAAYVLVSIVGVYTHFFFFFLLFAHLVFVTIRERSVRGRPMTLVLLQVIVVVAYGPWAVLIATHMPQGQVWKTWRHIAFGIPYTLLRFGLGYGEFVANNEWQARVGSLVAENAVILSLAAIATVGVGFAGIASLRVSSSGWLVLCAGFVPMLAAVAASVVMILVGERYFIVSYPFYLMMMATGLLHLWRSRASWRRWARALVILFGVVNMRALYSHYFNPNFGKEQWSDVVELLETSGRSGDIVVAHEAYTARLLEYYGAGRDSLPLYPSTATWMPAACEAPRTWLVLSHARDSVDLKARFAASHRLVEERFYPFQSGIAVWLFQRVTPSTSAGECKRPG